jgi:peroxiredoxin|tara:strand:- start:6 stop:569 length:564 start_codon:yes stop_codon:yes gene_type:complete
MIDWSLVFWGLVLALAGMSCDQVSSTQVEAKEQRSVAVSTPESPRVGFRAPTFSLPDLHGNEVNLSDLRGKVVLVNFWATWCGPCVIEMPSMEKLYREFHSEGFEILAVSNDSQGQLVTKPFKEQFGLTFPILHDLHHEVNAAYHIRSIPASMLIGKDGVITYRVPGARDWYSEKARDMIRHLLDLA